MVKLLFKEVIYNNKINLEDNFFLSCDIGGTNSNFGIFSLNTFQLYLSLHYKSKDIKCLSLLIKNIIDNIKNKYGIAIKNCCIAAAGFINSTREFVKLTNLDININIIDIKKITRLEEILLINDFEAAALGLDLIDRNSIININKGLCSNYLNMSIIGAGTGLGKSLLVWNFNFNKYLPIASEGGHADVTVYNEQELGLINYIYNINNAPVSWEDVLSGLGMKYIYKFLSTEKKYKHTIITDEIKLNGFQPDYISYYASLDLQCADVLNIYLTFYARCLKNFTLDTLSFNGAYIVGGIASKNVNMFFNPIFFKEFIRSNKYSNMLKKVPIYVVSDYNITLYGALNAFGIYKRHNYFNILKD